VSPPSPAPVVADLMALHEVCAFAGVGAATVNNFIAQGRIEPAVRQGKGGKLSGTTYNQNRFTRDQAERLKRYADALREFREARKALK
jgi:predicted site-specific integrase-resolvase